MTDSRFGYLGFVPGTRTERSFAKAEENDAQCQQVAAIIDDACLETQAAKVQMELIKEKVVIVKAFEVYLLVDADGSYAVGIDEDECVENYQNDVGDLNDAASRRVKIVVDMVLPGVSVVNVEVPSERPVEASVGS